MGPRRRLTSPERLSRSAVKISREVCWIVEWRTVPVFDRAKGVPYAQSHGGPTKLDDAIGQARDALVGLGLGCAPFSISGRSSFDDLAVVREIFTGEVKIAREVCWIVEWVPCSTAIRRRRPGTAANASLRRRRQ